MFVRVIYIAVSYVPRHTYLQFTYRFLLTVRNCTLLGIRHTWYLDHFSYTVAGYLGMVVSTLSGRVVVPRTSYVHDSSSTNPTKFHLSSQNSTKRRRRRTNQNTTQH